MAATLQKHPSLNQTQTNPTTTTTTVTTSPTTTTTLQEELALPILLSDRVLKLTTEAESNRTECADIARQVHSLSLLLRSTVRLITSSLYDRPIRRISTDITKTLEKTLSLIRRCKHHHNPLRHLFLTITSSAADFRKISNLLESSLADLKWLLSLYDDDGDGEGANLGIPPIASNDPILAWVWSSISSLHLNKKVKDRIDSANHLSTLARDNERYRKVIVEEGAVGPLMRLLKDGGGVAEGQIAAANALCCLVDERERSRAVVGEVGVGVIVQVLNESGLKVQCAVAELVAKIAEVDVAAREEFGRENVLRPLVSCLGMDLDLEDFYRVSSGGGGGGGGSGGVGGGGGDGGGKVSSIHSIVKKELLAKNNNFDRNRSNYGNGYNINRLKSSSSLEGSGRGGGSIRKERENETPEVKHKAKEKCALALWRLCEGSVRNSQKMAESKGLICLSKIIEVESGELRFNCLMVVMEVAKVAEENSDLRKVAWKPSSPPAKAVLEQLLKVIKEESSVEFRVPAIKAIGCLARIFSAKETGFISALVGQLGSLNTGVATEAAIALAKFACPDNHNCVEHSNTIIEFNGVPPLMKLLTANDRAKMSGLVLLCYLSMHVGNSKALAEARALRTLENAVRSGMAQNPEMKDIFSRAMHHLMLYQDGSHPHNHSLAIV